MNDQNGYNIEDLSVGQSASMAKTVTEADIIFCTDVLEKEAAEQKKSVEEHTAHLVVHGTLHAQGWDHETSEADAEAMEAHEIEIMQKLGFKNPY